MLSSTKLYRRLMDTLSTAILVMDDQLRLRYLNLAAESLLAVSGRQFNQSFIGDIMVNSDQDIEDIRTALQQGHSFTKRKTQIHLLHGKTLQVDYTITPMTDMDEVALVMEVQGINYAERISRDENLISTHETTRELVRGLAHEIKNPLGGIRGAAQLLASELPADTDLTDYTSVIIEEADRLHKLVDRLVGSRKPMEFRTLNIHEVLERVRNLVEAEVRNMDITVVRNYDPSIPEIQGDSEQLIQAVLNIVRNAVQALESPHVKHRSGIIELGTRIMRNITIGTVYHRLVTRIDIIDNGPGVPTELKDNIFFPMISGRAEGTGLGLSIAHSIVNQHKGIIECNSEPGRTCFAIYLPVNTPTIPSNDIGSGQFGK
ncbi:MAG TPA: nitrogen regulation protein NR(II) [Pseudohongiella sp.]|nr:nitrogen regulation protein NR(II) [Pseudohongiella sp.]